MNITLDMYQTIAVAVIVLMAGAFLKKRISFLQKFCIPAPVIGGLLFAILTLVLYMTGVAVIDFDDTLKEVCMVFFFTSVGFQANLKVLKSGGKSLIVFLFLVIMLIVMQNFSAIGLANLIGLDSLTGMTFPIYIGAMIVAAIMRNIGEYTGKITIHMGEINDLGGICLSLFLGIAMITLKLWQLADLALPLIILLAGQVVLMFIFTYFVVFNIMGRDYDAAVLAAGTCGFGMGATPNAMANMQAICEKYAPSVKAYLIVPIVGSLFADFLNSLTITFFINCI